MPAERDPGFFLIVNPVSGRGAGASAIPAIEAALQGAGLSYRLARSERPWHAAELARQAVAEGYQVVTAVGGDGTANEVLNGLLQARQDGLGEAAGQTALGVISVGRGNDFAYGAGIPPGVEAGCKVLLENQRRRIDVGRVSGGDYPAGRYFGNGVGIGFDAVVGFEALKLKRLRGFPSYIVAALKTIFLYFKAPLVRLEFNGQRREGPALMVSTMNGRRMGGGFLMAPQARLDDGLLDLCLVGQVSRLGIFALIPRFMQGSQQGHRAVRFEKTACLTVTALQGSLPAHADGETLCTAGEQLRLEVLPQQLEIVCPA
jgi:diacylglycerol kinase (ATP)